MIFYFTYSCAVNNSTSLMNAQSSVTAFFCYFCLVQTPRHDLSDVPHNFMVHSNCKKTSIILLKMIVTSVYSSIMSKILSSLGCQKNASHYEICLISTALDQLTKETNLAKLKVVLEYKITVIKNCSNPKINNN